MVKKADQIEYELSEVKCEFGGDADAVDNPISANEAKFSARHDRRVLIPVETFENGKRAIAHYMEEIRKPSDKLFVFHAVELQPSNNIGGTSGLFHAEQMRRQIIKKKREIKILQDKLANFLDENEVSATFYARDGERVGANILRFAREKEVNLIVMASKEQNKLVHAVLGQTSDYVLKHATDITVTIVSPEAHAYARDGPRRDSDTSCPGDLYGHKKGALQFLKPLRRRLNSEPHVMQMKSVADEPENEDLPEEEEE